MIGVADNTGFVVGIFRSITACPMPCGPGFESVNRYWTGSKIHPALSSASDYSPWQTRRGQ